jgi:hypothetical protein
MVYFNPFPTASHLVILHSHRTIGAAIISPFHLFQIIMQVSNIAGMEAYNSLPNGNFDNLEEIVSFATVPNTLKTLRVRLVRVLAEYDARIDNQAAAKVSVLAKGSEAGADVQFTPTAAFRTGLQAIVTAISNAETAISAIDLPVA